MFAIAALQMGYQVVVLDPDPGSPAGAVASEHLCANYDDAAALERISQCDAVTIEFENIPVKSMQWLADKTRLAPGVTPVSIAQNRVSEKTFATEHGVPTVAFAVVDAAETIDTWRAMPPTMSRFALLPKISMKMAFLMFRLCLPVLTAL